MEFKYELALLLYDIAERKMESGQIMSLEGRKRLKSVSIGRILLFELSKGHRLQPSHSHRNHFQTSSKTNDLSRKVQREHRVAGALLCCVQHPTLLSNWVSISL